MNKTLLLLMSTATLFTSHAFAADHSIELVNKSKWEIHEMYFAPTDTTSWGPDQLTSNTIATGGSFTLTGIPTGKYDVKLVDEDQDECVVEGVKIAESEQVVINDEMLLGCQTKTEETAEEE